MSDDENGLSLPDLIRTLKGDRTFKELEEESGGRVKHQRWHQFATGERLKEFPKPATIEAVAETLPVDREVLLMAFARFFGMDVHRRQSRFIDMLPPSVDRLSEGSKALLLSTARALAEAENSPMGTVKKGKPRPRRDVPPLT